MARRIRWRRTCGGHSHPFSVGQRRALSLHRVDAAEIWFWHAGDPLSLTVTDETEQMITTHQLGPGIVDGEVAQAIVPAGHWPSRRTVKMRLRLCFGQLCRDSRISIRGIHTRPAGLATGNPLNQGKCCAKRLHNGHKSCLFFYFISKLCRVIPDILAIRCHFFAWRDSKRRDRFQLSEGKATGGNDRSRNGRPRNRKNC